MSEYKYIYGPVFSWRLGRSLGIDILSQKNKVCNFSCIYCQLGSTAEYEIERKIYVSTESIIQELKKLPEAKIDYITFSGRGEPTLAKNLGEAITAIKSFRNEPIAIITDSVLINREDVRRELSLADFVLAKLDAFSQQSLEEINQPAAGVKFSEIVAGLKAFRGVYKGKYAIQIMFIEQNKDHVDELIKLVNEINPDEVQLNTPLRRSPVPLLDKNTMVKIKERFVNKCNSSISVISVYDITRQKIVSISDADTLKRRGK
jgi:wyosine [tRNA(Phe)-imidazoG37] synthetase (radical SAM superfamily)